MNFVIKLHDVCEMLRHVISTIFEDVKRRYAGAHLQLLSVLIKVI